MWNPNLLVLVLLVGSFYYLCAQDDSQQTDEDRKKECAYLNSVRANYTVCCQYPAFVIWMWQYKICLQQCSGVSAKQQSCCQAKCQYVDQQGLLTIPTNDDGSTGATIMNPDKLVFSFLISVGNDTRWEPVITNAVKRCYDDQWGSDTVMYCGFIPSGFFDVIDCTYNQNYLKCPIWNPHGLVACDYTSQYANKCW